MKLIGSIIVSAISIASSVLALITAGSVGLLDVTSVAYNIFFNFDLFSTGAIDFIITAVIFYILIIAFVSSTITALVRLITAGKISSILNFGAIVLGLAIVLTVYPTYAFAAISGFGTDSGFLTSIIFAGIVVVFAFLAFDVMSKKALN